MSTTVTYKGSTLATVNNNTKTLKTAGKYMEGDVILTDVSGGIDIPVFTVTYDSTWLDVQSVTCNKTFAQCISYYNNNSCSAVCIVTNGSSERYYGLTVEYIYTATGDKLCYTYTSNGLADYQIDYTSTGQLSYQSSETIKTSFDLTVNGATITVPYGTYKADATKSVSTLTLPTSAAASATSGYTLKATITPSTSDQYINIGTGYNSTASYYKISAMTTMTLPTAATSSATSGYTSKATISRSTSDQYINIPPGYNSTGAYYKISAVANGSATGPTSLSGSSATVSTGTNTLTLTKTGVTTTPTVSAGYVASATASTATVTLTASVTTKAATTYNTSTSNQTIAAGTYLTGAQTIRAVTTSNLSAANVVSGVTITVGDSADADRIVSVTGTFTSDATATADDIISGETAYINGREITGTLVVNNYYTGSTAPSSSFGSNGDIYFQS